MNLEGKKLLILTGCNGASDIIQYAKTSGVYTIATDYYSKSAVKDMADVRYDVSTTDIENLYDIAVKHDVDGVTTGTSEASMYSILNITERLGLPFYATKIQLGEINDKKKFKDLLNSFGVPVVKEFAYDHGASCASMSHIDFPVVVKPVDSSGAKGISVCRSDAELSKAYEHALKYSRSKKVIVEQFLQGLDEVFFNYTIIDGEFSLSCAFDIHRTQNRLEDGLIGLPVLYSFPSPKLKRFVKEVHPNLVRALKNIGIRNGTMSIQCFADRESFYIYEAGYRLGGAQMYVFTKALTGISVLEMMVNHSLTGRMTSDSDILTRDDPYFQKPCCQLNIPVKPGTIGAIEGVSDARNIAGVLNITEVHYQGDKIKADGSIGQLCLRVHIISETISEMMRAIDSIYSTVAIRDEFGNDMVAERWS